MPVVVIRAGQITDWDSFHSIFAEALGFPDYYGRNMAAWVDCLTYADDPVAQMVAPELTAQAGDVLTLHLEDATEFASRCPEQYAAFVECAAFVNWRRLESGERPIVAVSFVGS